MVDENWQIAGIVVSFLSFFTAIFLTFYIRFLDGKQRKRDESFYITATMKDIQQLKDHMINIQDLSECDDPIPNKNAQIEITQKLIGYTEKNKKLIELLISDTRFSMSKWMSLKDAERKDVEGFITNTNWVLDDYLPKIDESKDTQMRRWSNYFKEFEKRKNESSKKMDILISKYS
jgi:hypothetical protein